MTEILDLLRQAPALFVAVAGLLGLIVGSFLNVVIYRLPLMMERDWRRQCAELEDREIPEETPFSLVRPRSACPGCNRPIRAIENIPVISWLVLRGRCAGCRERISVRYPIIELLTGILSAAVAWRFGIGWEALFALFIDPRTAIIGAAAGYLSLRIVYEVFKLATGKEGMGFGDFKLLGALGAWLGWQALPVIILLSAVVGAVMGGVLMLLTRRGREVPIPFGPFLAAAGWIALLWGDKITAQYLHLTGLS